MTATTDPYLEGIMARIDKPDEATPADPAAIDLDVIRRRYCTGDSFQGGSICVGDISGLIAAVEALRARVAELEVFTGHLRASRDHAVQANEAAEARVVDSYAAGLEAAISAVKLVEPPVYPGTARPHIDRLDTIEAIRALGKEEE